MNALLRKVLQEILTSIFITEQKVRFRDGVDLRLGAIDTTNVNKKRGREKETIRKAPTQFKYNKYIEK